MTTDSLDCKHLLCHICYNEWCIKKNKSCPVCRAPVISPTTTNAAETTTNTERSISRFIVHIDELEIPTPRTHRFEPFDEWVAQDLIRNQLPPQIIGFRFLKQINVANPSRLLYRMTPFGVTVVASHSEAQSRLLRIRFLALRLQRLRNTTNSLQPGDIITHVNDCSVTAQDTNWQHSTRMTTCYILERQFFEELLRRQRHS